MIGTGWLARGAAPPIDETKTFLRLYSESRRGASHLRERLGPDVVVLVPGLFTERYPFYLTRARRLLKRRGIEVRIPPIDTDQTARRNAGIIRRTIQEIAKEGRRSLVVGHSKGPIDVHAALELDPDLALHVRALLSLQAPFAGTPLATDAAASSAWRWLVSLVVGGLFRGSPRAFFDLSYQARAEARPGPLPVPVVCLVTSTARAGPVLERTRRYIESNHGAPSDGFVPPIDAWLPGSRVVHLTGVDHGGLALPFCRSLFEPEATIDALLQVALAR
ncbi:MAG: hypothetical protein E6J61_21345 [Deltaproteobacteria bacterium]|nr:MAG: hypothetical protein E6J61_21345 [Deltaproteobacteria bacterium]